MSSLNGHADVLREAFDSLISDPRWPVSSTQYPSNMLPLASHEGLARLRECDAQSQDNFVVAARFFVGQGHLQCATASVAICLNIIGCIREKCGTDPVLEPHRHFTADDLMEELRPKLQPRHRWFSCSLGEIAALASEYAQVQMCQVVAREREESNGVKVGDQQQQQQQQQLVRCDVSNCDEFRRQAMRQLRHGEGCVVVNFGRQELGYATSPFAGHMSPVVAYHEASDTLLLLDVARKSWACVWAPVEALFRGMRTTEAPRDERCTPAPRGFLLLSVARNLDLIKM